MLVFFLHACTGYGPNDHMLGDNQERVIQLLGNPTTELSTPNGKILIYSRGPFGKHTYFVYLNHDNVVKKWQQVLDEKNFTQIKPGQHRSDVIATIGESKDMFELARNRGYVWNYRYENPHCLWFQVEFSIDNTVRSTMFSKPPECRVKGL